MSEADSAEVVALKDALFAWATKPDAVRVQYGAVRCIFCGASPYFTFSDGIHWPGDHACLGTAIEAYQRSNRNV